MISPHVAGPNGGPYRLKKSAQSKPVVLNQVLVGQPNNGLLNKGPFTTRSQIGLLIVRRIFGPIYGLKPHLAR